MKRLIALLVVFVLVCGMSISASANAKPAIALVPEMPRNNLPYTLAGSWVYQQYQGDYSEWVYVCAAQGRLDAFLIPDSSDQTAACEDWDLVQHAHSIRARLFHALDYFVYYEFDQQQWAWYDSIINLYTAYAESLGGPAEWFYLAVQVEVCGQLSNQTLGSTHSFVLAGLAAAGCHWAFDWVNPNGAL